MDDLKLDDETKRVIDNLVRALDEHTAMGKQLALSLLDHNKALYRHAQSLDSAPRHP